MSVIIRKNTPPTVIILFLILLLTHANDRIYSQQFLDLYGPYFGQQPPGAVPLVFAPGIISGNALHASPVFSPDGTEIYWNQAEADFTGSNILFSRMINNQWTMPDIASFCSNSFDDNPVFSPDGQKLFFNSRRLYDGISKERIWVTNRQDDGSWSEPLTVDPVINDYHLHWQTSVDNEGVLYFGSGRIPNHGGYDIFYSEFVGGHFTDPVNSGISINTTANESMPFIDPAKRFILFCREALYICRRLEDGSWSEAENVTARFPGIQGTCPQITPDENYLFFTIINNLVSTVYWVDAQFIYDHYTNVGEISPASVIPQEFRLSQNYPNPFNPSTTIVYYLPVAKHVSLTIYDIKGRHVQTLIDQNHSAGTHHVVWDGCDDKGSIVVSGVYFYRLETDEFKEIKKMMFMK